MFTRFFEKNRSLHTDRVTESPGQYAKIKVMRPLFLFLFLFFMLPAFSSRAQIANTDLILSPQNAPVAGPVKSLRISQYFGDGMNGVKYDEKTLFDFRYDQAGRLLEKTSYETDGRPYQKNTYEYDAKGNLLKSLEEDLLNNRKAVSTYLSDENSRVEYLDTSGQVQEVQEFRFDPQTRVQMEFFRKPEGSINWGIKKKLDKWGNALEQAQFMDEDEMDSEEYYELIHQYQYNHAGQITEQLSLDDGEFVGKELFVYDEQGRIAETTFYFKNPDNLSFHKTYRYNEHGEVTEWTWDNRESYARFAHKYTYEYTYDPYGNWILRKSFNQGFPAGTVERAIVYWEK